MSETRIRRSPQEILAAKEADLVNAKARAAVGAQMSNPVIVALSAKLLANSKARTDALKGWNGNPSQTLANRRQSHELWINEVNAEEASAQAEIAVANFVGPRYRALRESVASYLANGGNSETAQEMVDKGTDAILSDASDLYSELETASGNLAIAVQSRKAFIESKKAGKAQATQVATA